MKDLLIKKLIRSVKDRTIFMKINHRFLHLYRVKNRRALTIIDESAEYERLERKYHKILNQELKSYGVTFKSNKLWTCWFQGEESAPPLIRACFNSMRKWMPDKEMIVITDENVHQYIELPDHIIEKRKRGIIPLAQYSDIIRCSLLCQYGGLWCDATVLFTSDSIINVIDSHTLFVFKAFDLSISKDTPTIASNWLISSDSHNPILQITLNMLVEYWRREKKLTHYYIFHMFFAMAARKYAKLWREIPAYNNHSPHTLMFELDDTFSYERWNQILKISDVHKLTHHLDYTKKYDNNYHHILSEYLC